MPDDEHHGGCLCGEIRLIASGAPLWVGYCHCTSCRRATGGILIAAAGFRRTAVAIAAGEPSHYASSAGVRRGFCATCGTSLSYENELWPDDIHLMVAIFDRPELFAPQLHIFAGERLPWLNIDDDLPRYRTTPSAGERME